MAYLVFSADPDSDWADYSVAYTWVMDADGGNTQQLAYLTENGCEPLFWAEDGWSHLRTTRSLGLNCSTCNWMAVAPHLWTGGRRLG